MKCRMRTLAATTLVLGLAAGTRAGGSAQYDLELVPKFNIPRMATPPKIDGTIDPAEWKTATKVMGMVLVNGLEHKDRPVSFYLAWDPQHLYLAYRADILTGDIPHLQKAYREKYGTGVIHDDALDVGLFLHDRNKKADEVSSFLKFVINALGVPESTLKAGGERVRIRQLSNLTVQNYYLRSLKWMQARENKALPPITPTLDLASGTVSGFDINYHDIKILVLDWEEKPVDEDALKALAVDDAMRRRLLDWGLNAAAAVPADLVVADNPGVKVEAWKRAGDNAGRGNSVLLRVANTGEQEVKGTITLDLKGLDVGVRKVWAEFTDAVPLDGQRGIAVLERADQPRGSAQVAYNAYAGELYYSLAKGQSRVFSIDRY